jgi:hypothetical protein
VIDDGQFSIEALKRRKRGQIAEEMALRCGELYARDDDHAGSVRGVERGLDVVDFIMIVMLTSDKPSRKAVATTAAGIIVGSLTSWDAPAQ